MAGRAVLFAGAPGTGKTAIALVQNTYESLPPSQAVLDISSVHPLREHDYLDFVVHRYVIIFISFSDEQFPAI